MKQYKRPAISTGELNKPVDFFVVYPSDGPEAHMGDVEEILFTCMAEVYESSMKDMEAHSTVASNFLITMKIRDTYGEYLPETKHQFRINHHNYPGDYNVIDVSPDTRDEGFIKIVGEYHG